MPLLLKTQLTVFVVLLRGERRRRALFCGNTRDFTRPTEVQPRHERTHARWVGFVRSMVSVTVLSLPAVAMCATVASAASSFSAMASAPERARSVLTLAPDLAFDTATMLDNARRGVVIIKNIGAASSAPTSFGCNGSGGSKPEQQFAIVNSLALKALAPGESFTHSFAQNGDAFERLECAITPVAGEQNTANNAFKWAATSSPIKTPFRTLSNIPKK